MILRLIVMSLVSILIACGSSIPEDVKPQVYSNSGDLRELSGLPLADNNTISN
tara:strand:- start:583 stop:741 length:159 start_codon:yes stop_codon:yes gene_type:complete